MRVKHTNEIWKWVVVYEKGKRISYEGYYKVSNYGRIRRTKTFTYWTKFGRASKLIVKKEGIVNSTINVGYLRVNLNVGKGPKECRIHNLVLWAFKGSCPLGMECRHLDDDRLNNHIDNLEWGTHQQNGLDSHRNGKHPSRKGENHPGAKLSEQQVQKIRTLYKTGDFLQKELGYRFNATPKHINDIICKKTWKHI